MTLEEQLRFDADKEARNPKARGIEDGNLVARLRVIQMRPRESIQGRRGPELGVGVAYSVIRPVPASTRPMRLDPPPKEQNQALPSRSAMTP